MLCGAKGLYMPSAPLPSARVVLLAPNAMHASLHVQVNKSGLKAAARYDFTPYYWVYDWQTDAMTRRKYEINAGMRFYKQEYCGCSFSLRDNNLYRKQHGQPPVRIGGEEAGVGSRYYVDPEADAAEESQDEVRPPATPRPSSMRTHSTHAAVAAAAAAAAAVHQA